MKRVTAVVVLIVAIGAWSLPLQGQAGGCPPPPRLTTLTAQGPVDSSMRYVTERILLRWPSGHAPNPEELRTEEELSRELRRTTGTYGEQTLLSFLNDQSDEDSVVSLAAAAANAYVSLRLGKEPLEELLLSPGLRGRTYLMLFQAISRLEGSLGDVRKTYVCDLARRLMQALPERRDTLAWSLSAAISVVSAEAGRHKEKAAEFLTATEVQPAFRWLKAHGYYAP